MNNKKVLCFLTLGAVLMSSSVFAQDKVALVIGNAKYKDLPLKNPVNDAKDMKAMLEKAGFTVIYADDAEIDEMDEATNKFIDSLDRNSLSLFYYSGHGLQVNGVNYLLPINANIKTDNADTLGTSLKRGAYSTNDLLSRLEGVKNPTNIVILDACRNNPLDKPSGEKGLYVSKGLGIEEASDSFLVAYATAPGKVATDDQKSKNSLYTKYLKQYLFEPGLTIESALKKVSKSVKKENPSQVPWYNNSIDEELCLAGCSVSPPTTPKTAYAPLLSFVSGANSVNQNKSYTVKFKGTDADGDLSKILVDWGDGSAITSKTAKENTALSLSHTYKFAGIYDLIATAIDKQNAESETYSQEVQVKEVAVPPVTPPIVVSPVTPPVVVKIPDISNANASPSSITQGSIITFNVKLSATLPNGYSVKIDYGSGLAQMKGSNTSFSLIVTPKNLGSSLFTVGIYDNSGNLKSNSMTGNYSVSELVVIIPPLEEPVVTKTTGYSKIANNGSTLADSAKLGANSTDWACTKDNKTGLIWEVKTTDGGLRDSAKTYTNYTPDYPGGSGSKYGDSTNTDGFVTAVNNQSLCSNSDWRLPTRDELQGLVVCSDGKYNTLAEGDSGYICSSNGAPNYTLTTTSPTINATYFPDIKDNYWFWSSSPYADSSNNAWHVYFGVGFSYGDYKSSNDLVRLVRG